MSVFCVECPHIYHVRLRENGSLYGLTERSAPLLQRDRLPVCPADVSLGLTQHHPLSRAARLVLSRLHELIPPMTRPDWNESDMRR